MYRNKYHRNLDPYWTMARFKSKCHTCGKSISKGKHIYYRPNGKTVYCESCGKSQHNDFQATVQDEEFYNSQY